MSNMTARDKWVLGVFVPALMVGTFLYIRSMGGTSSESSIEVKESARREAATTVAASSPAKLEKTDGKAEPIVQRAPMDYKVVVERNLFRAPLTEKGESPAETTPPPAPPPLAPPPMPVAPPPATVTHDPTTDKVAVVGTMQVNGTWKAMVEDYGRGETRYVPIGETAFGYAVKEVSPEGAVLEREGRTFRLALGEGKPEVRVPMGVPGAAGVPGRPGAPVGGAVNVAFAPGQVPDLANMSSDQRRQWFDQWRQSFANMTPQQQEQAREQMREYWRSRSGDQGGNRGGDFGGPGGGFGGRGGFGGQ